MKNIFTIYIITFVFTLVNSCKPKLEEIENPQGSEDSQKREERDGVKNNELQVTPLFLREGLVAAGHDVVSYFEENVARKGSLDFEYAYQGGTYSFSSQENQKKFQESPEKYIPQYGGFCAYALALAGTLVETDPATNWEVYQGKLYFNATPQTHSTWSADKDSFLTKSEPNWRIQVQEFQ